MVIWRLDDSYQVMSCCLFYKVVLILQFLGGQEKCQLLVQCTHIINFIFMHGYCPVTLVLYMFIVSK